MDAGGKLDNMEIYNSYFSLKCCWNVQINKEVIEVKTNIGKIICKVKCRWEYHANRMGRQAKEIL